MSQCSCACADDTQAVRHLINDTLLAVDQPGYVFSWKSTHPNNIFTLFRKMAEDLNWLLKLTGLWGTCPG